MGALPTLPAATDPTVVGGHDQATQQRLWTVSEELTGLTFPLSAPAGGPL